MKVKWTGKSFMLKYIVLLFLCSIELFSQDNKNIEEGIFRITYEPYIKSDISVLTIDTTVYIPLEQTFELLKINVFLEYQKKTIYGFYINLDSAYNFDFNNKIITYSNKTKALNEKDFIIGQTDIYIKPFLLNEIFELNISSKFSKLLLTVKSQKALPIKLESDRKNQYEFLVTKEEKFKDKPLIFDRSRSWFNGGNLTYNIRGSYADYGEY
ncbi:MAG: hypothetical protein ABSG15_11830, partial [FCB group bacterium]